VPLFAECVWLLSGWFLRTFAATAKKRVLVNVSSLLAVKPFPYWGLYATGKAARDHMHACIAAESVRPRRRKEAAKSTGGPHSALAGVAASRLQGPDVRTLNYAPGPLNGGMQNRVRVELGDPEQRGLYASMHAEVREQSVARSYSRLGCLSSP